MKTVEFLYDIGDSVVLASLKHPAQVIAMMVDAEGPAYRVCYWWEGARRCEWLFAWELA